MKRHTIAALILTLLAASPAAAQTAAAPADLFDRVTHGYATSEGGVKIHYASLGSGPLVVMIHGFPDFWYSWRHQMAALADRFQVVAIDQRGYNLSDKPKGVESYDAALLVGDVAAVVRHLGRDRATIVGHDWGGVVCDSGRSASASTCRTASRGAVTLRPRSRMRFLTSATADCATRRW